MADPDDPTSYYDRESLGLLWYLARQHGENVLLTDDTLNEDYLFLLGYGQVPEEQFIEEATLAPYGYPQGTLIRA